ncbi:MAG: right-handed parallel beta-helix repeat-containing protein [Candidatus Zixiibacteriota bacterium]
MKVLLSVATAVVLSSSLCAAVIHVPGNQPTIQAGINAASAGDTVLVDAGLYTENVNFIGKAITLRSVDGRDLTTIKAAVSSAPVVTCSSGEDTTTILDGFSIDGNSSTRCVTVSASSLILRNCEIVNGYSTGDGGGIYLYRSASRIRDNRIRDNHASGTGGGICAEDSASVGQLEISGNEIYASAGSVQGIGCLHPSNLYVHHNVIRDNLGSYWFTAGIYINGAGTNVRIINNTIVRNSHAIVTFGSPQPLLRNNIIASNLGGGLPSGLTNTDYNDIWNSSYATSVGPHDINADPLFVWTAGNDFHLQPNSPCINAGDPATIYKDPDGTRNDIGALPIGVPSPSFPGTTSVSPVGSGGRIVSLTPTVNWTFSPPGSVTQQKYQVQFGEDSDWNIVEDWDTGPVVSAAQSVVYAGPALLDHHTTYYRVRVYTATGWTDWAQSSFMVSVTKTIRVPQEQATIAGGISYSTNGDTVLIAPGTYFGNFNLSGKRILLKGERGYDSTRIVSTVAGSAIITCNTGEDTTTIIEGLSLYGNLAGKALICTNSSIIIRNCEILNCTGNNGGGIYCYHSGTKIRNNWIHNNNSEATGSGICIEGSAVGREVEISGNLISDNHGTGQGIGCLYADNVYIHHNVIWNNTNTENGWYTCGVYFNRGGSNLRVINNTIVRNGHGIVTFDSPQPVVRNNIIALNLLGGVQAGLTNCDYNNLWNNHLAPTLGLHEFSMDPGFVAPDGNDFHLSGSSPCINSGDPNPIYNDSNGTPNDMGALQSGMGWPSVSGVTLGTERVDHIVSHAPTFDWTYGDNVGSQQSYQIEVGTDNIWDVAEVWQSGEVSSGNHFATYGGLPLVDGASYYVRVRCSNGVNTGNWGYRSFRMNSEPSSPSPYSPVGGVTVTGAHLYIRVLQGYDAQGDSISLEFELYQDPALTQLAGRQQQVPQENGLTTSMDFGPLLANRNYYWRARGFDGLEYSAWSPVDSFYVRAGGKLYVSLGQRTIQEVVDYALDGDTVIVGPGTYHETIGFTGKAVVVQSTGGAEKTVLVDTTYSQTLVSFRAHETSATILEGFTLRGGTNGIWCQNAGPTIRRNIFESQSGYMGIAILLGGADEGASGVSPAVIVNNTIVGAQTGGIACASTLPPTIENNIIAQCSGYGISGISQPIQIGYNDVFNNQTNYVNVGDSGAGAISADPLFTSGYRLPENSPCVDAGDPGPQFRDADGSRNDMGALPFICCYGLRRGDLNLSGMVDLADLAYLVAYLIQGNPLPCLSAANVNGVQIVDLADLAALVSYLTGGGYSPGICSENGVARGAARKTAK